MPSNRDRVTCVNCGEPASDTGKALPVAINNGDYVANGDTVTEWGGQPACDACYVLHAAAGDRCNEVLAAYFKAAEATLSMLDDMREAFEKIARLAVERREL